MAKFTLRVHAVYDVEIEAPTADLAYESLDVGHPPHKILEGSAFAECSVETATLTYFEVEDIT